MSVTKNKALKQWEEHCQAVQQATTVSIGETPVDVEDRIKRARRDYAYFVEYYFPHYAQSKTAKFQIKAANKVLKSKKIRGLFEWARGHAKSTHFTIFIPMWLMIQEDKELNFMLVIGKSEKAAFKLLGDLQAELQYNHRYNKDYGKQYNAGSWEEGHFVTKQGVAFMALGRGQSPRGIRDRQNRPDYIVFDDIDDDQMVRNEDRVNKIYDWLLEAVLGSMDMGRGRFIGVGNRIHKKSITARFSKEKGVYHTTVNALDKKGQPSWSEKYTIDEINEQIALMGYRRSQKEYFNNPVEEGTIFREQWISWGKIPKLETMDGLVLYGDPSFKDGTKNDYKAVRLWAIKGAKLYLLRSFVRQTTVTNMVSFYYDVHQSLPEGVSCQYWMEANFLQDMLLEQFKVEGENRGYHLPIRGDKRKKPNKFARIENLSPYYERGVIVYDEKLKEDEDTKTGLEQLLAFEKGSKVHDDCPDADEGAIYMLQKNTRSSDFEPVFGQRTHRRSW